MVDERSLLEPIGSPKTAFHGWTDQALDGYIIIVNDQISGSMFETGRAHFQRKLDEALREREFRRQRTQGTPTTAFHSEVVMKEEIGRTYTHEVSGSSDPGSTEDGD